MTLCVFRRCLDVWKITKTRSNYIVLQCTRCLYATHINLFWCFLILILHVLDWFGLEIHEACIRLLLLDKFVSVVKCLNNKSRNVQHSKSLTSVQHIRPYRNHVSVVHRFQDIFDKLKAKFTTANDLHLHDILGDTTIEKDRSFMTTLRHQLSMNYQNIKEIWISIS